MTLKVLGEDLVDRYIKLEEFDSFIGNTLWSFGRNHRGQLGDNTTTDKSSPVQTITGGVNWQQVALSTGGTVGAIKTDGTLWMWGDNSFGALGDNSILSKSSPVQTVSTETDWKYFSGGHGSGVAAIKTAGTLWVWGRNDFGYLGATIGNKSSPVQTTAGGTNWKQVSVGHTHLSAVKTDGSLWTWGTNQYGQLGDVILSDKTAPTQTSLGTNWKFTSCGNYFTAAIKNNGELWLWGRNMYGALGNGNTDSKSSPVQTVAGGTNWKSVSCGFEHTGAIKTDGTLWLWGNDAYGLLGDGTSEMKSSPVQTIAGGTNWKSVSCGGYNSAAIKTDGTLWTWGLNDNGQLGNGNVISYDSPVQTIAGGTNWKSVSCGTYGNVAITYTDLK
jgi:alpha-tubulin suppressor-like RCC1 family protein